MNKGDKFICIKKCEIWISEKSINYKYDSDISEIGELVEFIAFLEYDQVILLLINGDEYAIYEDYFFNSFITLAEWRQQQIDKILEE
jgi:hypothetical protein